MMRLVSTRTFVRALVFAGALSSRAAVADLIVKDGNGATQTIFDFTCFTTKHCTAHVLINSAGAEVGTAGSPLRVDPTGTTPQPVSGTVTANQGGAPWTINPGTAANWGVGATGSAVPASGVYSGVNVSGNLRGITGLALGATFAPTIAIVDGSGNQITSFGGAGGTASNFTSAFPSSGTAAGWSDGTNMQGARVFDADSGGGTQYVAGVILRKSASGGSVEGGTLSDPLRTDPTGTTTQPVSLASVPSHPVTNAGTFATQPASATAPVSTMNSASANAGLNAALAGVFDDTTPTAITENSFGFLRMSANRNLYGTIRDAAGNERGANVNASNELLVALSSVPSHAVTNAGTFAVQAAQAGTWNVGTLTTLTGGGVASGAADSGNPVKVGGRFNGTPPTLTDGQRGDLQLDASGNLKVSGVGVAAGSTTSGQTMSPIGCAVTTAAPTYTNAQTNFVSCDTAGGVRVNPGTVTVTATNLSTNVAQFNGVTPLMGNGASGTGAQRIAVANDNSAIANWGHVAVGAAPPVNAHYVGALTSGATGGLVAPIVVCDQNAFLNMTTATTTEIVALVSSRQIMVCSYSVTTNGTSAVKFVRGTGTNCGTGTNDVTANDEWTAQTGMTRGTGIGTLFRVTASNALCVTNGSAQNAHINVTYAIL